MRLLQRICRVAALIVILPFAVVPFAAWADDEDEFDEPAVAEVPPRRSSARPATPDEIPRLIADLSHVDGSTRDRALERLAVSGQPAIDALTKASRGGSLETRMRAVLALKQMFLESDGDLLDSADNALTDLAADGSPSVAARAESTLEQNYDIRESRAVEAVREMGGIVTYSNDVFANQQRFGYNTRTLSHIVLGKDWKTGDEGLKQIRRLTRLQKIYYIADSGVTEDGLKMLQRSIPALEVHRRARSCLGVSGQNNAQGQGCVVFQLIPKSAASRAGFEIGDVIQTFDGHQVTNFDKLIELIGATKPGDKIKVEVLRDFKKIVLKPVMDEWKN